MAKDFRDYAEELAPRGGWLSDDASKAWLRGIGSAVSEGLARWRETVKARFAATAPDDALPLIGDNRQLEQAPRETNADYRVRLRRCFEIHEKRGTRGSYSEALYVLGISPDDVVTWNYYEDCSIPAPGGADPWWSLITIVVESSAGPWSLPVWHEDGSDLWGDSDSGVWGVDGLIHAELQWLRRTIRAWKWTGAYPLAIYVVFDGNVWGDGSLWSDGVPDTWEDVGASVAVLPLGHVWGEETYFYGASPVWVDDGSETWEEAFTFE